MEVVQSTEYAVNVPDPYSTYILIPWHSTRYTHLATGTGLVFAEDTLKRLSSLPTPDEAKLHPRVGGTYN